MTMRLRFHSRRRVNAPRPRTGVSLIEIMIAMTILGLVMMSLGKLSVVTAQRGRTNEIAAARTAALQQQSNKFSTMPFDSISTFPTATKVMTAGTFQYRRRLTISAPNTNRRRIVVVIVPVKDSTKKDSLVVDRSQPPGNTPLCVGCP
jgi:prepilin-type N-terminal cleavage/methylation domain-containing protein